MEDVLPAAVLGVLEALGHDARRGELPEIHVLRPVAGKKQIEEPVTVVIEPDGAVGVDPRRQPGPLADRNEAPTLLVVKQFGPAVLVQEQILVAVVVVVAPDGAHRDAGAGPVHVGDAHLGRHILEGAVTLVAVEMVLASLGAVRDVEVLPAVPVEIRDGNRRTHRGDLRHDGFQT